MILNAIIIVLLSIQTIILVIFVCQSIRQRSLCTKTTSGANKSNNLDDIDVVIAAKESYEIISNCVSNLLSCGFNNIKLCIDGGDSSILKRLEESYPQVVFLQNKHSLGKIKSQLKCLEISTKKNILILDADISLIPNEVSGFVSYFLSSNADFLCPYSVGISSERNSLLFGIAESDRYMRQRVVRAGRDAYGVSNLSGYCMLADREKYIDIIDTEAIQDDVIATINLFKKGYTVKTYHKAVCSEIERTSLKSYLLQKTRWTAGNIVLVKSYPILFKATTLTKAFAFTSSFLLWYWSLWVDFIAIIVGAFCPIIYYILFAEWLIKYWGLIKASSPNKRFGFNALYCIAWPIFSTACLVLSPYYLMGKIVENKTRR